MPSILELIRGDDVRHFDAGQVVIEQGERTDLLFFLVDVKQQFQGNEHLGMVDDVLETLMHRQPVKRVKPSWAQLPQKDGLATENETGN
jgi:hypothetical protein